MKIGVKADNHYCTELAIPELALYICKVHSVKLCIWIGARHSEQACSRLFERAHESLSSNISRTFGKVMYLDRGTAQ